MGRKYKRKWLKRCYHCGYRKLPKTLVCPRCGIRCKKKILKSLAIKMKKIVECTECGRKLKISKRKYRKWEDGEIFIICNECKKRG